MNTRLALTSTPWKLLQPYMSLRSSTYNAASRKQPLSDHLRCSAGARPNRRRVTHTIKVEYLSFFLLSAQSNCFTKHDHRG